MNAAILPANLETVCQVAGDSQQVMNWPEWWEWEIELSAHLVKRMADRNFSEIELRSMMESAEGLREDIILERWVVISSFESRSWEIIVEPDPVERLLVVITAYPVD